MWRNLFLLVGLVFFSAGRVCAADLYVAPPPTGSDAQDGSEATPFATIQHAALQAFPGDTVHIKAGTYREEVDLPRSGEPGNPITLQAWQNEAGQVDEVIVSGFDPIEENVDGSGSWQLHSPGIWKIELAAGRGGGIGNNLVLRNGIPGIKARWPNVTDPFDVDFRNMVFADSATLDPDSEGPQPPFSGDSFFTATYSNTGLPDGDWTGALIDLSPGNGLHHTTGVVTSLGSGQVEFRYLRSDSESVSEVDPYFLWNSLAALDADGEFYFDVAGTAGNPNTLYVISDSSPAAVGEEVELRERIWALRFRNISDIHVKNLILEGGGAECRSLSVDIVLDGLDIRYAGYGLNALTGATASVTFKGSGLCLKNSSVRDSFSGGVLATGTSIEVTQNVIGDCFQYAVATFGGHDINVSDNTTFGTGGFNIAMFSTASRYLRNHCYLAGLRTTDEAIINSNFDGDAQNCEVAWNWAHTNVARRGIINGWGGGKGIRLDSGSGGVSNYIVHHNVIWNLSSAQALVLWSLEAGQPNSGNSMIRAYHNTVDGDIVFAGDGSIGGHDVRNNISQDIIFRGSSAQNSEVTSNVLYDPIDLTQFPGNFIEQKLFVAGPVGDFRLDALSPILDTAVPISTVNDVFLGGGPDPGAIEYQAVAGGGSAAGFRPGATLMDKQLDQLEAAFVEEAAGSLILTISGFPEGRVPGNGFRIRIDGGTVFSDYSLEYLIASHQAVIRFKGMPSFPAGQLSVEFSNDGGATFPVFTTVEVPAIPAFSLAPVDQVPSPVAGGALMRIEGTGFQSGNIRIPIEGQRLVSRDLNKSLVPVILDTSVFVSTGQLPPASHPRLQFVHLASGTVLDYQIDSGYGTSSTLAWVKFHENLLDQSFYSCGSLGVYFEIPADGIFDKAPDPGLLGTQYPLLDDPRLLIWLSANTLLEQPTVDQWLDASPLQNHAVSSGPSVEPVLQAGALSGLASLKFDGVNDFLFSGDLMSTIPEGISLIVLHRNEEGADPLGRMISSGPTGAAEEVQASAGSTTGSWVFKTTRRNGGSLDNFTIGRKSRRQARYYKGELAEVIFYEDRLETDEWNALKEFVSRKYQLGGEARASLQSGGSTSGMQVSVEGVGEIPFRLVDSTEIEFTTPPLPEGFSTPVALDVVVTVDGNSEVLTDAIYYGLEPGSDAWRSRLGLGGEPFDWTEDLDADSLSLVEEYGFDLFPQAGDASKAPQLFEREGFSGVGLEFRQNLLADDLEIFLQWSSDLMTWSEADLSSLQLDVIDADIDGDGSARLVRVGLYQDGIGGFPQVDHELYIRLRLQLLSSGGSP